MVRALAEEQQAHYMSRLFNFRGTPHHENAAGRPPTATAECQPSKPPADEPVPPEKPPRIANDKPPKSPLPNEGGGGGCGDSPRAKDTNKPQMPSDMELLKDRFSKLLLGEDMSGGGKGVSSALALSNAFTNLAASIFGEQKRLEPMAPERKARWRKEIDWLLSVTDHIVELVPSNQKSKDGVNMEVMTTRQRNDLHMNIPALRKLDAMLIDCLDNFKDQNEFTYATKEEESEKGKIARKDDKWWIPLPKVPPNGFSEATRKWLQFQKDSVNQVQKAAMAINALVLSEMDIPENYIDSLPKNGRASLGDLIYRSITVGDFFDPDQFLSTMDLSSELKILDLKNRIEASIVIWKRKMIAKDGKSAWGSAVSMEKRELFEERAETILLILKHRFPGIPQSALEISKIQYNRDVGQAILESYSRILESLAFTVISRIDDVLHADSLARNPTPAEETNCPLRDSSLVKREGKVSNANEELEMPDSADAHNSMTLSDFMGWNMEAEGEMKKDSSADELLKENDAKSLNKPANILTSKKFSYLERLENLGGLRSPTARH